MAVRAAAAVAADVAGLTRAAVGLGLAGAACVAYGTFVERDWYRLREVRLPGLLRRPDAPPLRVLHLSDIHLDPPQGRKEAFLEGLAGEDADLVVLTGDLLGAQGAEERMVELLAPLVGDETPGILVLGSNDLYGPIAKGYHHYFTDPDKRIHGKRLDTERLVGGLADAGYRTLHNEAVVVDTRVGTVAVGGIDDPHLEGAVIPDADQISVRDDGAVLRLGAVHAPYTVALDRLIEGGYELLVAGHTHGGQVRFPPVGAVIGNCDLPLDQVRGESRYRSAWLHVSPGMGTSRYAPFRFACRPEATMLVATA